MKPLSVFILLLLSACSSSQQKPDAFIEINKMRFVVWDMAKADELANIQKVNDSSVNLKEASFKLYDQVFAVHNISRDQFYKSLRYYEEHPQIMKVLMDSVRSLAEQKPLKLKGTIPVQ